LFKIKSQKIIKERKIIKTFYMDFSKKPLVNDNNENKKQTNESPFKIRQNRKRFFFKFNKIIKYQT